MPIIGVHQVPSLTLTQERYEQVVRRLTDGKSRIESPADLPFKGCSYMAPATASTDSASSTSSPRRRP
jgi:hypothetical protein